VGEPLVRSILRSLVQQIAHRMAPGIVGAEVQAIAQPVLEINLQAIVVVVAIRILIGQGAEVWIGLEEVERVLAGHGEPGGDAWGELVADQAAEIRWAGRQRLGQRARNALVQIQNEGRIPEALGIGKRRLTSERAKSGLKNGE